MPNHADIQSVPTTLVRAVEDVYSGVLPMVEEGDLGQAFAVAGELKGVRSFDPAELPAGTRFVPFDRDNPDLVETPDYIHNQETDPRSRAQEIARNVGSISVTPDAPGIVKIHAPDGGVHTFLTLRPDALVSWLGGRGYTAPNLPKLTTVEAPAETVVEKVATSPAVEVEAPTSVVPPETPGEKTTLIPRIETDTPGMLAFPVSEQLQAARRILDRMAPQLAARYELSADDVQHALNKVWYNYRGLKEVFSGERPDLRLDDVASRVVRAAFQEVVRVAPRGPQYAEALLSGKRIAGFDLAVLAAESSAMQPYLTILADTPSVRRRDLSHEATRPAMPAIAPSGTERISAKDILPSNLAQKSVALVKRGLTALNGVRRSIQRRIFAEA